jgi:hypothetical protein
MQALDMSALEEFKKLAAEEQAQRALQPIDPENDPARYSFHRSEKAVPASGMSWLDSDLGAWDGLQQT